MRMSGPIKIATLSLVAILLAQCGGKKSRSAESSAFTVHPEDPIVFTGPGKDSKGDEVQGPWFQFTLAMNNTDASDAITIVGLELEISGTDENGFPMKKTASFYPSTWNKTKKVNDTDVECKYGSFGEFPKGVKDKIFIIGEGDSNCVAIPVFMVGSLPPKKVGSSYRFKVKVRPLGWFGTETNPKDRFDTSFTFYTQ